MTLWDEDALRRAAETHGLEHTLALIFAGAEGPVEPPDDIDDPHPQLVWLYWDEEHAESRWKPLREVTDE